jgi:signal transduction histidine kinase
MENRLEGRRATTIIALSLSPPPPPVLDVEEAGEVAQLAELERRIAELERALSTRDELIGMVGHELRNPLSPVFLQAYHLMAEVRKSKSGTVSTEWLAPRLELFLRGLDRLLERLNRLMDVAALQSPAGIALTEEELDLTRVTDDVVLSMARDADTAACSVELSATGPVTGRWDRLRLEQVIGNLLANAIHFAAGSHIEIVVRARSADTATVIVRDDGPGIATELQPRLFERFERADTQHQRGGLGLGLWIVRRLCERMGGRVAVDSQPGRGASFLVTLPRIRQADSNDGP